MVLESLLSPLKAEKRPWEMVLLGFLYSSAAVFLSAWIFKGNASMVMVFLTTLACVPLIYNMIRLEEKKDESLLPENILLKEHARALSCFGFLFLGITLSFSLWYLVLPSGMVGDLFSVQQETLSEINGGVTGMATQYDIFNKIFFNNVKVLLFCLLFAFLYGVGAIFVLTWNASVIGAALGNFVRTNLSEVADATGLSNISGYFHVYSFGILRYAIHGIPEIMAYFTVGLAGGIVSIAIIRHNFGSKRMTNVLVDSSDLVAISFVLIFLAAILEVYVTPLLL